MHLFILDSVTHNQLTTRKLTILVVLYNESCFKMNQTFNFHINDVILF